MVIAARASARKPDAINAAEMGATCSWSGSSGAAIVSAGHAADVLGRVRVIECGRWWCCPPTTRSRTSTRCFVVTSCGAGAIDPGRRRWQPRRHRRDGRALNDELGTSKVLRRTEKSGLGRACPRAGFVWVSEGSTRPSIEMDSDLSHDPAALPALVAPHSKPSPTSGWWSVVVTSPAVQIPRLDVASQGTLVEVGQPLRRR